MFRLNRDIKNIIHSYLLPSKQLIKNNKYYTLRDLINHTRQLKRDLDININYYPDFYKIYTYTFTKPRYWVLDSFKQNNFNLKYGNY